MIELVVDVLAAFRLTRLIVVDDLLASPRRAAIRAAYVRAHRAEEVARALATSAPDFAAYARSDAHPPKLAKLLTCWWCASFWCALIALGAPRRLRRALALSAAAVIIHEAEDRLAD